MTAIMLDNDMLELLDFEPERSCETFNGECPNKPKWIFRMKCCGANLLLCDEHRENWFKQKARWIEMDFIITCFACDVPHEDAGPEFIPLG